MYCGNYVAIERGKIDWELMLWRIKCLKENIMMPSRKLLSYGIINLFSTLFFFFFKQFFFITLLTVECAARDVARSAKEIREITTRDLLLYVFLLSICQSL